MELARPRRAAQRGSPPNPVFLFDRVVTAGDVDITRFLGIGLTELRGAWVRAVAAQQWVANPRQVQDAATTCRR